MPRGVGIKWKEVGEKLIAQIEMEQDRRRELIAYLEDKGQWEKALVAKVPHPKTDDDVATLTTGFVIRLSTGEWEMVKERVLNST